MVEILIKNGKLRELVLEDLPIIVNMSKNREIAEFYYEHPEKDLESYWRERFVSELWYKAHKGAIRQSYSLPIEHEGQVKGLVAFHVLPYSFKWDELKHLIKLSYFIGPDFRRKGIAESAVRAAIPFAFRELNAGALTAVCFEENFASRNLLQKIGLNEVAKGLSKEGEPVSVYGLKYDEISDSKIFA